MLLCFEKFQNFSCVSLFLPRDILRKGGSIYKSFIPVNEWIVYSYAVYTETA
jgi:hypothetical protein